MRNYFSLLTLRVGLASLTAVAGRVAAPALAEPIPVVTYDMANGDGQAIGGTFNYWDRAYDGIGATKTDSSPLRSGRGDLTDGNAALDFWYNVEKFSGTGPYVGWHSAVTSNPVVYFNFAGAQTIREIRVYVDNSRIGGVRQPAAYLVNGEPWSFTPLASGTHGWVTLTGTPVTGSQLSLRFMHPTLANTWLLVSEVNFAGTPGGAIPDPAALLQQLLADVAGVAPGASLANKVELAQTYYAVPDVQATCAVLSALVSEVHGGTRARTPKPSIELAAKVAADAEVIMALIGCN